MARGEGQPAGVSAAEYERYLGGSHGQVPARHISSGRTESVDAGRECRQRSLSEVSQARHQAAER